MQEPAKREEQARLILQWCLEDQEKMVAEAMNKGMEQLVEAVPGALPQGAPVPGSSAAAMPPAAGTRALVRLSTDEEYERTKKKRATWMMKVELAEMQQKVVSSSDGGAKAPQEHQEQAETKAEKAMEKQAQVEAAVSVITEALKQHALPPPGGQQPTPALRSAQAHSAEGSSTSGSAAGSVPAHAPDSGMQQAKATAGADAETEAKRRLLTRLREEVAAKRMAREAAENAVAQQAAQKEIGPEARRQDQWQVPGRVLPPSPQEQPRSDERVGSKRGEGLPAHDASATAPREGR